MKLFLLLLVLVFSFSAFSGSKIILNKNNSVTLTGEITSETVGAVMLRLQELDNFSKSPIYLVLNTPGGSIFDGLELISFAKSLNRPVHTINIFSASMGFQIAQHLGNRYVTEFSELMSHKARGGFQGEFPGQLDSRYVHILNFINDMDNQAVARTKGKQTLKSYRELYENEYWAKGTKAVKDGFADEIVSVQCDSTLKGVETRKIYFGPYLVTLSFARCPMITVPVDAPNAKSLEDKLRLLKLYRQESRKVIQGF